MVVAGGGDARARAGLDHADHRHRGKRRASGASATAEAVLQATTTIFTPSCDQEPRRLQRIGLHGLGALGAVRKPRGVAEIDEASRRAAAPPGRGARSSPPMPESNTPMGRGSPEHRGPELLEIEIEEAPVDGRELREIGERDLLVDLVDRGGQQAELHHWA